MKDSQAYEVKQSDLAAMHRRRIVLISLSLSLVLMWGIYLLIAPSPTPSLHIEKPVETFDGRSPSLVE